MHVSHRISRGVCGPSENGYPVTGYGYEASESAPRRGAILTANDENYGWRIEEFCVLEISSRSSRQVRAYVRDRRRVCISIGTVIARAGASKRLPREI